MAPDQDYASWSFRAILFLGMLLCGGAFKSWQDFRFATVGKQATSIITKISEDRSHGRTTGYRLYYDFVNDNTKLPSHHYTLIDLDEVDQYAVGQRVPIDYYGEKYPETRLHGTNNRLWVYFFFASLTALTTVIAYLSIRSAREDGDRNSKKTLLASF